MFSSLLCPFIEYCWREVLNLVIPGYTGVRPAVLHQEKFNCNDSYLVELHTVIVRFGTFICMISEFRTTRVGRLGTGVSKPVV